MDFFASFSYSAPAPAAAADNTIANTSAASGSSKPTEPMTTSNSRSLEPPPPSSLKARATAGKSSDTDVILQQHRRQQQRRQQDDAPEEEAEQEQQHQQLIQPISKSSIHRIVAGQAVTDLASAVKELVDNAIDARASKVFVKLHNQGFDAIEVSDNGTGVPKSSRPFMAMKHATSKLKSFDDLYNDNGWNGGDGDGDTEGDDDKDPTYAAAPTLGFRGEALFCLANLSRSLVISTRCDSTTTDGDTLCDNDGLGEQFAFNHEGQLIQESVQPVPRSVGTTVTVNGLFETVPVRRVDMQKRMKTQRMKLMKMMQGYAILCLSTQFNVTDVQTANSKSNKSKSKSDVRLATPESSNTLEKRIASVLGTKFLAGLTRIQVDLTPAVQSSGSTARPANASRWKLEGLVSHAPTSPKPASARDLQFFSINGRPVDLPSVSRVLGDVWRSFDPSLAAGGSGGVTRRPACILAFTLPNNLYDVNLSPDKREVLFTEEVLISGLIREGLMTLWSDQSEGKFAANEVESRSNSKRPSGASEKNADVHTREAGVELFPSQSDSGKTGDDVDLTPRPTRTNAALPLGLNIARSSKPENLNAITPQDETILLDDNDEVKDMQKPNASEHISLSEITAQASEPQSEAAALENADSSKVGEFMAVEHPRPSHQDRRNWEQMRLDFRRNEKDQLQEDIQRVLSSDQGAEEDISDTPPRKRSNDEKQVAASRTSSAKRSRYSSSSNNETLTASNHSSLSKQSSVDVRAFIDEFASVSGRSRKERVDEEEHSESEDEEMEVLEDEEDDAPLVQQVERRERSLWKENGISNRRNVRMLRRTSGSGRREEPRGSKQPIESGMRSRQPDCVAIDDGLKTNEPQNEVTWDAFSGTRNVMASYKNARKIMHSNRKHLRSALKRQKVREVNFLNDCDESAGNPQERSTVQLVKDDFLHMSIIGQYNLGFILARCRKHDLWILDQHACDEKYNFERFCKDTVIHEQKLIAPLPLELSPSEENCVLEHMDIFEQNGFRFDYNPEKEPRHRLSLTALPHSGSGGDGKKAVQFNKEDVGALVAMLGADGTSSSDGYNAGFGSGADGSGLVGNNAVRRYAGLSQSTTQSSSGVIGSSIVRLPKAIAMFASRACRGSIMIGDALSHKEQSNVVKKLHKVDVPWNCPHGRPTLSHVTSLAQCMLEDDRHMAEYVAGPSLSVLSQE